MPSTWPHPFPPPLILPPEEPARFRLSPVSLVTLALCMMAHVGAGLPRWQRTPLAASQDIGVFVFGFLVAITLGWLCWRIAPRKHAGEVAFCCLLLLFAGGRMMETVGLRQRSRIQAQPARDRPRAAAPAPPGNQDARATPSESVPLLGEADTSQDLRRRRMEALAAVAGNIQVKVHAYEEAAVRLKAAGGGSGRGLDSLDAIAGRRRLTRVALDANTSATIACQTVEDDLLAALRRAVPEADARETARQALSGIDQPTTLRIRDCERRGLEAIDGELALFQQEFTRWHIDADNKLVFDNPAVNPWYTRWSTQLRDAAEEGARLRREMAARHPPGR